MAIFPLAAIDCGYTDWSACSECSLACGGGTRTFKGTCVPLNGVVCSELELTVKTSNDEILCLLKYVERLPLCGSRVSAFRLID